MINSITKQTIISILKNKPFLNPSNQQNTKVEEVKKAHANIRGASYYSGVKNNDN